VETCWPLDRQVIHRKRSNRSREREQRPRPVEKSGEQPTPSNMKAKNKERTVIHVLSAIATEKKA